MHEAVIVGEAVAGEATKLRRKVESAINTINASAFDVAEGLAKIVSGLHYTKWGFNTRTEYFKTLNMSASKADYLTRIGEVMAFLKIPRADYEPLGIAKLREISSLKPNETYTEASGEVVPMADYIRGFIYEGQGQTLADVQRHVRTLKGIVGENDKTHFNLMPTRLVMEQVFEPAIAKMRLELGPVAKDADGMAIEATATRCMELICAKYLTEELDDDTLPTVNPVGDTERSSLDLFD